jgi:hypothetical protein
VSARLSYALQPVLGADEATHPALRSDSNQMTTMIGKTEAALRPKRRSRTNFPSGAHNLRDTKITASPASRLPRMKKTGNPHQGWAKPDLEAAALSPAPTTVIVQELVRVLGRAWLNPVQSSH